MKKKVILFIVEGPTDEAALNSVFKAFFRQPSHRFQIVHGDVTSDRQSTPSNIKIKVSDIINSFINRYRYNKKDILQVIHLVDTDGAFIPDEKVIRDDNTQLSYHADYIQSSKPESIIQRNHRKRNNINNLAHCNIIAEIPYKMLYFSRHLEHVLHNIPNPDDIMKMSLADQFDSQYKGKLNEFIKLISDPQIAPSGNYDETWEFIQKGTNSLHRHSNLHLIFDPASGLILPV